MSWYMNNGTECIISRKNIISIEYQLSMQLDILFVDQNDTHYN